MRFSAAQWKPQKKYSLKIAENGFWQLFSSPLWNKRAIFFAKYCNKPVKDYDFANIASIDILICRLK